MVVSSLLAFISREYVSECVLYNLVKYRHAPKKQNQQNTAGIGSIHYWIVYTKKYLPLATTYFCWYILTVLYVYSTATLWRDWWPSSSPCSTRQANRSSTSTIRESSNSWRNCLSRRCVCMCVCVHVHIHVCVVVSMCVWVGM